MIDQVIEIRVPCPPEEAFRFVARDFFENHRRWDPAITELTKTSRGAMGVGTTGTEVRSFGGKQVAEFRVTEYEPARRFAFTNTSGAFWLDRSYTFVAENGGSLIQFRFVMRPRAVPMRVLGPLFKRTIERQVRENIDRLAALLGALPVAAVL